MKRPALELRDLVTWTLFCGLVVASAVVTLTAAGAAFTSVANAFEDEPPPPLISEDIPFTVHTPDPEMPGDLLVERWVCDVTIRKDDAQRETAEADCEAPNA